MASKTVRLRNGKDFERVFLRGIFLRGTSVSCKALKREDDGQSRVGFAVGKKEFSTIVQKNFLKRRLKIAFFPLLHRISAGFDIVILTAQKTKDEEISEITKEIEKMLIKCEVIVQYKP